MSLLKTHLERAPEDGRARAALIMLHLRLGERDVADDELASLSAIAADIDAERYVSRLTELITKLDQNRAYGDRIADALRQYRTDWAVDLIDQLDASPLQKEILRAYGDVYEARYGEALRRLGWIRFQSAPLGAGSVALLETLESEFEEQRQRYALYQGWIEGIAERGDHAGSNWRYIGSEDQRVGYVGMQQIKRLKDRGAWADAFKLIIVQYLETVNGLAQVAPLDSGTIDTMFEAALLFLPYDQFQSLADTLLRAKGSITLRLLERDGNGTFFIDVEKRKFVATYDKGSKDLFKAHVRSARSFELRFDEYSGFKQKAGFDDFSHADMKMLHKPAMLDFGKGRVVTNIPMLGPLTRIYGELAARQVIYNFGRYVAHVLEDESDKARLLPLKAGVNWWGVASSSLFLAAGTTGAVQGDTATTALWLDHYQSNVQEGLREGEQQRDLKQAWNQVLANRAVNFLDRLEFHEIEDLLGAIQ